MPEPMSEEQLPSELLRNGVAEGGDHTDPVAHSTKQLEAAPPAAEDNLPSDGHNCIPATDGAESLGFLRPSGLHAPHLEDVGSQPITAVRSNNENVSEESQEPCTSKPTESAEGVAGGEAEVGLLPHPAQPVPAELDRDEPAFKLVADNGVPAPSDQPDTELQLFIVSRNDSAAEPASVAPEAGDLAYSCVTDPSAEPTRGGSDGTSSHVSASCVAPAVAAPAAAAAAAQAGAEHAGAEDAPPPNGDTAEAEISRDLPASTSVQAPTEGSGEALLQEHRAQQQQAPSTTPNEADVCTNIGGASETAVPATEPPPAPLNGGDQAEPAAAVDVPAKEDMDILGNGKLIKKIIKPGNGSHTRPQYGSQVSIKCQGQLPNGTMVDQAEELSFILHDGDVIAALDLAVALMELGEECQLQTASDFAYKGIGRHPDIPPDTPITYTIELLTVSDPLIVSELPVEQIIALADKKRDRGNYLYSRTEYDSAVICYSRAVQVADDPNIRSEDTQKLQMLLDLRLKCYNNLAATQVKAKQYEAAVESCEKVLKIQPLNVKALFRKGKSLGAMGSTKEAVEILKQALKLEPSTKVIHRELYKLQEKLKKDADDEKILYKKMMGLKNASGATGSQEKGKQQFSRAATYGIIGAVAAVALSVGVFMLRKYL